MSREVGRDEYINRQQSGLIGLFFSVISTTVTTVTAVTRCEGIENLCKTVESLTDTAI
jgi:hypothetical protein